MGTISILLGFIIFLASIFGGFGIANAMQSSMLMKSLVALPTGTELYLIVVGICGFIGLLICVNFVMLGLTYNKVSKLDKK